MPSIDDNPQSNKVEAIYDLRQAVEDKVCAEQALEKDASAENRDALLDAQLTVEARTQDAIEACLECGQRHRQGEPHGLVVERKNNVLGVNFKGSQEHGHD